MDSASGFWNWITTEVMRRPFISLVLTAGLLVAAAVQYFDINTGASGVSQLPDDFRAKKGFQVVREEFGFGLNAPVEIVIDDDINSDLVQGAIQGLMDTLKSDSSSAHPVSKSTAPTIWHCCPCLWWWAHRPKRPSPPSGNCVKSLSLRPSLRLPPRCLSPGPRPWRSTSSTWCDADFRG